MRKLKVFVLSLAVLCVFLSSNIAYAADWIANFNQHNNDKDNLLIYRITKDDGTKYDCRSKTTYTLSGNNGEMQAFCAEPGISISWRVVYEIDNGYTSDEIKARITAALTHGDYDVQYRQIVVWMLIYQVKNGHNDGELINDHGDKRIAQELFDKVMSFTWDSGKKRLYSPRSDVSFSASNLTFSYNEGVDGYVSNTVTANTSGNSTLKLNNAPSGAYMVVDGAEAGTSKDINGNKSVYVVIPRTAFTGNVNLNMTLSGGADYESFTPCTTYHATGTRDPNTGASVPIDISIYRQKLATPGTKKKETGSGAANIVGSAARPMGNLSVAKIDKYNSYIAGANFHITGPHGFDEYLTTTEEVKTYSNLDIGVYTVTELDAPNGMILNSTPIEVTVSENNTVLATIKNDYQRGKISLRKRDKNNGSNSLGNASLAGAEYSLYAAEDIKEGKTLIYGRNDVVKSGIITKADGTTDIIDNLPLGTYYFLEDTAPIGYNISSDKIYVTLTYAGQHVSAAMPVTADAEDTIVTSNLKIYKKLGNTDYDPEINLSGVQFKAELIANPSQVYYSNVSGEDGVCQINNIPYGEYKISECKLNDAGYKIPDFTVNLTENGKTYIYTKIDPSKPMRIAVTKEITLREGEATDAKVSGAYFTIYRDEACTNRVCEIGPTDEDGYAISGTMRTGTYYMKETTFPTGIDPDAVIPGEDVTYRNKVYVIKEDNRTQGSETITSPITIQNEPNRNHIEILKEVGKTSNTSQFPLDKCEFTATLKSTIGTDHVFSRKCTAETRREDGYCIIEDLPYGTYVIEETKVSPITLKCANFEIFVQKDKKVKKIPYAPADSNFLATTLGETEGTTKDYSTSYEWVDDEGKLVDVPKVMEIKIRKVDYDRTDVNPVDYTQGDAELKGAIYEIYRYDPETDGFTEYVYDITVDHKDEEGYWCAESRELLVGDYMVKEKIKKSEVGKDGKTYDYSYAEGYLVDPNEYYFRQNPEEQTVRKTFRKAISKEKVVRGSVKVLKYDNQKNNSSGDKDSSSEIASKGAVLRLVLNSSIPEGTKLEEGKETDYYKQGKIWYEVKIDENGAGEFLDKNDDMHTTAVKTCYGEKYYDYKIADIDGKYNYSCTIPYGDYTIIETKESDSSKNTSFYTQPVGVDLEKQTQIEYRIEADDPVPMYLKIQKRDKVTGATVAIEGITFKIWDIKNRKFVSQLSSKDHKFISEFVTSEDGLLTTPEQLLAGEYIVYETKAPKEYYLEDELRLPKDSNDIGVIGKGGKHVVIDKTAMEIKQNTISNTLDYFYTVDMSDRPLVTSLEIIKKGDMLTSTRSETTPYGEKYTPVYEMRGLKGVTYEIYAAEDIKSPDGRETYVTNGTKVDTITTDSEGKAKTKELYPGEYRIVETITPLGYVKDTNIPNVILESSHDELVRVNPTIKDLTNTKQKTKVYIEKKLEKTEYDVPKDMIKVVVGLYSNKEIKDYTNNTPLLNKGTLVDVLEGTIKAGETLELVSDVNLPFGDYYAKELYVDYPYEMDTEKQVFEVKPKNVNDEILEVYGIHIVNKPMETAELAFVKISTSAIIDEAMILHGGVLSEDEYDEIMDPIIEWVKRNTGSTVKAVFNGEQEPNDPDVAKCRLNPKYTLSGAVYSVYYDNDKKEPLTKKGVPVTVTTDESGFASLTGIPVGEYYIFEEVAPVLIWKGEDGEHTIPYKKQDEAIKVSLSREDKDKSIARLFTDDITIDGNIKFTKEDIFTGELIPDCTFEIMDSKEKVIVNAITDKKGEYQLSLDWFDEGETYYYREISAPGIYDLNTEPHEFKIEFDENGELVKTKIENRRKTRDLLIRKTDAETGELLQGCVFTIAMINEDGTQKVNAKTGEPIYLVENALTDENGEYYIEDAPMGTYMFTEITPPEGYELDEDLTGYKFTLDENSPELTIFEVTNTGDIAVIALSVIAIVSVLGIAFSLKRNSIANR